MRAGDCVLHLSGEYPDSLNGGRNSPVVRRLVEALAERLPQVVVSINRSANPLRAVQVEDAPNHLAVRYFAPPWGIGHHLFLHRLADTIGAWLRRRGIRPTLIVGHKFTIEGVLAARLAPQFDCAYALGFMNTTDEKLWRALPWCRGRFERIAGGAAAWVFPTPVSELRFVKRLSVTPRRVRVIPYISDIPALPPTLRTGVDPHALLTVFNFNVLRHKNFERLVEAVLRLRAEGLPVTLDVAGHGQPSEVARVQRVIARHHAEATVRCLGHVPAAAMGRTMQGYAAMALPSAPESFGLVYLEALAAGIPVLSSRGYALDGCFDGAYPGVKVDPASVGSIAEGLHELVQERPKFAAAFDAIGPEWRRFGRAQIQAAYLQLIDEAQHVH